jgi:hypothetical protein
MAVSGYTMARHEVWADEVHSWNIAKGSSSYPDLVANRRYEGHPPGWYTILWTISKFTHNIAYMKAAQWAIACTVVFMVLFFSPFPLSTRILIPFGYYFLFEYGVLSRNYAIGVLLACCICLIIRRDFKYKLLLYYVLLFCLSNTHLLAMLLAGSLHLYFLLLNIEQKKTKGTIALHALSGVLIFLPALYFIAQPSDSQQNIHFWINKWNIHFLTDASQAILRCLLPVPAWWNYHFWNTEFLMEAGADYKLLKYINPLISISLLALAFSVLRKNKKSLLLFGANLLMSFIICVVVFPLTAARYAGFIYIGFIVAYWLYCYETPVTRNNKWLVNTLLAVQLIAGVFFVVKDIRLPFSNLYRVKELTKEVPAGEKLVTDYWTMNAYVAFMDQPAYCIDMQKKISFVLWGPDITAILKNPYRYSSGLKNLFTKEGIKKVYMISMGSPQMLGEVDPQLPASFHLILIDKREGAIEKGSNLYLYQISAR